MCILLKMLGLEGSRKGQKDLFRAGAGALQAYIGPMPVYIGPMSASNTSKSACIGPMSASKAAMSARIDPLSACIVPLSASTGALEACNAKMLTGDVPSQAGIASLELEEDAGETPALPGLLSALDRCRCEQRRLHEDHAWTAGEIELQRDEHSGEDAD